MNEYEVEFKVIHRTTVPARSHMDAANKVYDSNPGCTVLSTICTKRNGPEPDAPCPAPSTPRGRPTPGGSPAGGVARVPVPVDAVAA